jgi:prophage antirepressor-like protein
MAPRSNRRPSFRKLTIRAVEIEAQPWFVAIDVCQTLGLTNTSMAVRTLPSSDVSKVNRTEFGMHGGGRPVLLINESGLYKLVMRSDKPEAREYQHWVTQRGSPSYPSLVVFLFPVNGGLSEVNPRAILGNFLSAYS